ncbi:MAG: hypothetical protein LBE13_15685 [Bacteroidales bacterium]|jgi:hypothetical protein|nr:hypothetical protein [Bacteroidales bacterium]
MSNENKIKLTNQLIGTNITPIETGIMYFLAFEGLFCIMWLVTMFCNYSFNITRPVAYLHLLSVLFFCYIIFKGFRSYGYSLRCFAGLSLPLIIFWIIVYIQRCIGNWHYGKHPILGFFLLTAPLITMIAFSIPVKKENLNKALRIYLIPLLIIAIIIVISWHGWLLKGASARTVVTQLNDIKSVNALWNGEHGGFVYYPNLFGGFLGLISLYGFYTKNLCIKITLPGYILGTILIYFGGYKSLWLSWCFIHLLILLVNSFWKKRSSLWIIPLVLIINISLLLHVGKIDSTNISNRIEKFLTRFTKMDKKEINTKILQHQDNVTHSFQTQKENIQIQNIQEKKWQEKIPNGTLVPRFFCDKRPPIATHHEYNQLTKLYSSDPRFVLYNLVLTQIRTYPIFGYGDFFLVVKIGDSFYRCDVHSNLLSAFMTTGIVGGLFYCAVILIGFRDSIIVIRYYQEATWLAIIFLFSFIANLTACEFSEIWVWLPLVALHAYVKSQPNEQNIVVKT